MGPVRRYMRITRFSVLEVRIYLDNPALADSWLLNSRDPVLPQVIDAVRPLVLPKLREENENAKRKGAKRKKGIRDVVVKDDFEVSMFLTDTSTNHSLLTKQKSFANKPRMGSNSNKLRDWLNDGDNPIHVEDDQVPQILQEEGVEETTLDNIPDASDRATLRGRGKRTRDADDDESIFVHSSEGEDDDAYQTQQAPAQKRKKLANVARNVPTEDDKKKLALNTSYEGFSIYGRILCLIVKRKGPKKAAGSGVAGVGSEMMESWVSTQAAQEGIANDDDDG